MNNTLRIIAYVVLLAGMVFFGARFYMSYVAETKAAEVRIYDDEPSANNAATDAGNKTNTSAATAETEEGTNAIAAVEGQQTNASAQVTASPPPGNRPERPQTARTPAPARGAKGQMIANLGAFLAIAVIFGLLAAHDASHFFGNRAVDFLFNEDLKGVYNPEYEQAEQMWANGRPLEAIQMMREYLKKHPREQYVALRIAEIYEKDLSNYLAAALEYEEVLKHKLPRERWGWAAIHLCNLYSKMGKTQQCVDLLRRIDSEYSETAAAKKARKRLGMFESVGDEALGTDLPEDPANPGFQKPVQPMPPAKTESPPSNLPPGFRPKKG